MTRRLIQITLLGVAIAACSNGSTASTTTQAVPTTVQSTTTVTNPPLVNGGLIPIDPATLIPVQGGEPILVADFFWGEVSPGGTFAAIQSVTTGDETHRLALIDLVTDDVISDIDVFDLGVDASIVTDAGAVVWLSNRQGLVLYRLDPGSTEAEVVYDDFPQGFSSVDLHILPDGRFGIYGVEADEQPGGLATLILVTASADSHEEIQLANVIAGFANESDPDATVPVFEFAGNAPVWTEDGDRFILVEAARDIVTEVDLATLEAVEHSFTPPTAVLDQFWAFFTPVAKAKGPVSGVTRQAVLAPDGQTMFIATSVTKTEVEESSWETTRSPKDLMVLDMNTWDISILDIAVDTLDESPDGRHLLAHGSEITEGTSAGFELQPSPVYVVDMSVPEVLLGFQTSDESAAELQFSLQGDLVYISTWSQDAVTIDILDLGLLQLTGAVSFRELSLVGKAGYMAFHLE